ncbi:hypothetical protein G3578_09185 [Brevibacillus sp. SYP-B805]|uniref:hypothetical protein n=1 Tax=Brevibacillus sp. SYP-B805 TaxID=1578199 RepID=UPI0013E9F35B|nr:hypothetical protein [Brevibacillus sp. SYP-B805]NGQ95327.1 hypothetical protein [Brevibacillus sp. SYP-B805]
MAKGTKMILNRYGSKEQDFVDQVIVVGPEGHDLYITLDHAYEVGMNQLDVHLNGQWLASGGGYEEIDAYTIRLDLRDPATGLPVQLEEGDEIHIRNWFRSTGGVGSSVDRYRLAKLEEEIMKARKLLETDSDFGSLDQRLDHIQQNLAEVSQKVIVYVIPSKVKPGVQKVEIRFPFKGTIAGVYASCRVPGSTPTELAVEKISQDDFDGLSPAPFGWQNIFSHNLILDAGEKSTRTAAAQPVIGIPDVQPNDHFRVNVLQLGTGLEDVTVEVVINV